MSSERYSILAVIVGAVVAFLIAMREPAVLPGESPQAGPRTRFAAFLVLAVVFIAILLP